MAQDYIFEVGNREELTAVVTWCPSTMQENKNGSNKWTNNAKKVTDKKAKHEELYKGIFGFE